jgi:hypothetical protein
MATAFYAEAETILHIAQAVLLMQWIESTLTY